MTFEDKNCGRCSSRYLIESTKVRFRTNDSIACYVCGHVLIKWNGLSMYAEILMKAAARSNQPGSDTAS